MKKEAGEVKKFSIIRFMERFGNVGYAMRLLFYASPKFFILYWSFAVVMAFFPLLPLCLWKELLNKLIVAQQMKTSRILFSVAVSAGLYCVFLLLKKLMDTLQRLISYAYNDEIDYYIDNLLIDITTQANLGFFDSSKLKDELDNVTNLMNGVTKNIPAFLFEVIKMFLWNIISLFVLAQINLLLPAILVILLIPSIIGDRRQKRHRYGLRKKCVAMERRLGYYQGLFQGSALFEMKLYGLKDFFSKRYEDTWKSLQGVVLQQERNSLLMEGVSAVLLAASRLLIYGFVVMRLVRHQIGVGDVSYYISVFEEFCWNFTGFFGSFNELLEMVDELNDIRSFLEKSSTEHGQGGRIPSAQPKIEFREVSFRYPNSDTYVLHGCTFCINPREIIGLVGLNGAGKSTIVKLCCRFYDPTEGQILVDGIDMREYDIHAVRALFATLFQDYACYSLSLRENIALSDIRRRNEDEALQRAIRQSRVSECLEDGSFWLDEPLTRRFAPDGKELSGGQWQRVSLARTFFRNAPIVLLDEPSAALDPVAEHEIFKDFSKAFEGKSALLISHRLSSIHLCDRILVLEEGHIVEEGSHQELLRKNGRYAYLFRLQAEKYQTP